MLFDTFSTKKGVCLFQFIMIFNDVAFFPQAGVSLEKDFEGPSWVTSINPECLKKGCPPGRFAGHQL